MTKKSKQGNHSEKKDYEEMFPNYEPKDTPDTIYNYPKTPKEVISILTEIGKPSLDTLQTILTQFKKYHKKAGKHPGEYIRGNIALGAGEKEYVPSKEALLASELGKMIKNILQQHSKREIKRWRKKMNIPPQELLFTEILFTHVDVMGSGRFFYAEKKSEQTKLSF
ncbi:MAG: hypothetical protein U9O98_02635 [Asgard group archaeon]|nr:hypothetical protein [Asgard group archaeon]